MFVSRVVTVLALKILVITAVRAVGFLVANFLSTLNATQFLNSVGCLKFRIKDKLLKKLDNPKTNKRQQQDINIADQEKQATE